jgi:type I restriction enzyme S subunit
LLDNNYLWHWLTSSNSQLLSKARGATFLQVNRKDIESLQIPLPPLDEQKRIAAILDAADELRAKRRQTLVELDTLIQSTFLDMFGDPVTNPKGWNTDRFEKALEGIDSGWSPKCLAHSAEENEWGILKLGAVTYCIYNDKTHKGLPPHEEPREKIEVKKGDLLFARKNTHDLVAGSAYVWETRPKLMLPDLIFRLQLKTENTYNKIFLWQLLVNKHQKKTIQKLAGGAAGSMPNISKAKLKSVELVIPPLLLQQHFANIVEKIEAQKARCRSQLEELDTLFGSLQSKAFRGEL